MSETVPAEARKRLAELLRRHRDSVATDVTTEFLGRHPEWVRRYGELAWTRGVEDAAFHVDFLAGAIQAGTPAAFEDYARWTGRVLHARSIAPAFLDENLVQVRDRLARVLDPQQQAVVGEFIGAGRAALAEGEAGEAGEAGAAGDALAVDRRLYVQAVLDGQRLAALNIAQEAVRRGTTIPEVYCQLLQEAQYEVGRLWERNEISVAREHMATAITQFVIAQLYGQMEFTAEPRGNAVITGVEGELHQLGANMVADVLESEGWNVRFLGTQLPHRDVLRALDEHEATLLGISTTMLFNLPRVAALVAEARQRRGDALRIIVGGGAFRSDPEIWRGVGADGYGRDIREAVRVVNELA